jgi:hypothetical protein
MCDRQCPACGSGKHAEIYGLSGFRVVCLRCGALLANRRDGEAAPTSLRSEADVAAWVAEGSGVLEGADARDPRHDVMFGHNRWPLGMLAC